jgi:hypothetical protein
MKGQIPSLAGEITGSGTRLGYELMSGMDYQLHCLVGGSYLTFSTLTALPWNRKRPPHGRHITICETS